ncbi:MAG: UvrD-helicase domain-containing protein [Candidatus Competibacteraceae bacterium]|nr:UvrD-helicase domain-containing protein [Candidatus Competibacteraceae bacterium]MCB1814041.1 UvrD-helicase domain-containing protein [Candidatus Competibacteraceae bacterium]
MNFRIADTFTDSLAKLTGDEQKAVKTTAFDLQLNPASPGMSFHRLDKARDKNFWSVRVSSDIRLIVHKTDTSLLLCYVDHHDPAYRWAERRKLETHPKTGAAQLVEIRETVQEITVPKYIEAEQPAPVKPALFTAVPEEQLLGYGVPVEWLDDVRQANEDTLLDLVDHLPGEAAEALLELATGGQPQIAAPPATVADPFEHPDAQRRFRVMADVEELARALDYPWEKWTLFLHPVQRQIVTRDYNGPARAAGSAGTGKTIVALHRAVYLARQNPAARVLLTTFSDTLANALRAKLRRLISNEPKLGEQLEVYAIDTIGERLFTGYFGTPKIAVRETIEPLLAQAAQETTGHQFSQRFLLGEWEDVVDAWQLESWDAYRDVRRLGRKTRLPEAQRALLWSIFERVKQALNEQGLITLATLFSRLAARINERQHPPFEFAVVDEAQDINVPQLRFLAALGGNRPNSLFFSGDLGQRIFQTPFSWKALGVDIRGRSHTLHINYRTSHQIRMQADHLLGPEVSDVDGNTEKRHGTVSVFNGPVPTIQIFDNSAEEQDAICQWLVARSEDGILPHEIGVFARSPAELERACAAVESAGLLFNTLDERVASTSGRVSISTMHLAKGLEFRAVVVMACDDEVIPQQARIETVADDADLEEVYNTERHLLYVACTRARDYLFVTGVDPASEFIDDLRM